MYCIDAEVIHIQRPETLIGQYGLYYEDLEPVSWGPATERTITAVGTKARVEQARAHFAAHEGIDLDTPLERIETADDAKKYIEPTARKIGVESRIRPNAAAVIEEMLGPDQELLLATAGLWHESRRPFKTRYSRAAGILLELISYDQEQGWCVPHSYIRGQRTLKGEVTRRKHGELHVTTFTRVGEVETGDTPAAIEPVAHTQKIPAGKGRRYLDFSIEVGYKRHLQAD